MLPVILAGDCSEVLRSQALHIRKARLTYGLFPLCLQPHPYPDKGKRIYRLPTHKPTTLPQSGVSSYFFGRNPKKLPVYVKFLWNNAELMCVYSAFPLYF